MKIPSVIFGSFSLWISCFAGSTMFTPVEDTMITNDPQISSPQGSGPAFYTGTSGTGPNFRSLLKFDLSIIPTNAIVTSVTLTLRCVEAAPVSNWVDLHRLLKPWSENASTWTNRLAATPWNVPGAAAPLDYASEVSQSAFMTGVGSFTFTGSSGLAADVQNWCANPSDNFGWFMVSRSLEQRTVRKWASRENATVSNRPILLIEYSIPAIQPTLTVISASSNQLTFSFNSEPNRAYDVEQTGKLPSTNWTTLTNVPALPHATNVVVSDSLTTNQFYRVQIQ
ncbi:MAG: hypothetical protein QOG91_460 [Candidatus Parcubacteria bacterium]|jgi:hypothetical protein|nr:hypothetical protein [Candidatus Parcubacteria bacterium]